MVTLQILVLSFLVRIQVAQLKRLSAEGRFFVVCMGIVVDGALCALVVFDSSAPMHASCKESNAPQPRLHTTYYTPATPDTPSVVPPDSHFCWLSRYDSDLLDQSEIPVGQKNISPKF